MLSQTKLITAGGIDYTEDGKVVTTVSVPQAFLGDSGRGTVINQVFSGEGQTARQSRLRLDRKVSEQLDATKNQVLVLGEEVAKNDIYPILDVFYRDPKSALNAKMVVSIGSASEVINSKYTEPIKTIGIGEYLKEIITSAERDAVIPTDNLQTICPVMFDPGQDFVLPLFEPLEKTVRVAGLAFFHKSKMVGTIKEPLSVSYILLTGEKPMKELSTTERISSKHENNVWNFISVKVKRNKRDFTVKVTPSGKISAHIKLKTNVVVTEYPLDNLDSPAEIKKLENQLSKIFTKNTQEVIDKIQEMNSDTFGVGRKLMAFHYPTWEKLNWSKDYQKVDFSSSVDVQIDGNGIIE